VKAGATEKYNTEIMAKSGTNYIAPETNAVLVKHKFE
jgi:hypothetical protein